MLNYVYFEANCHKKFFSVLAVFEKKLKYLEKNLVSLFKVNATRINFS